MRHDPELFYGFWGTCYNDYRDTEPHEARLHLCVADMVCKEIQTSVNILDFCSTVDVMKLIRPLSISGFLIQLRKHMPLAESLSL